MGKLHVLNWNWVKVCRTKPHNPNQNFEEDPGSHVAYTQKNVPFSSVPCRKSNNNWKTFWENTLRNSLLQCNALSLHCCSSVQDRLQSTAETIPEDADEMRVPDTEHRICSKENNSVVGKTNGSLGCTSHTYNYINSTKFTSCIVANTLSCTTSFQLIH